MVNYFYNKVLINETIQTVNRENGDIYNKKDRRFAERSLS